MNCRMWRGWTSLENAPAYRSYLIEELFPTLERDLAHHGYLGFEVLTRPLDLEVEFVTLVWFESLSAVRAFAGEDYEAPVISEKARTLVSRYEPGCTHFDVSGSRLAEHGAATLSHRRRSRVRP